LNETWYDLINPVWGWLKLPNVYKKRTKKTVLALTLVPGEGTAANASFITGKTVKYPAASSLKMQRRLTTDQ
jgi:hypothetical protein